MADPVSTGADLSSPHAPAGEAKTQFGVYVHWPFCLSKCPYCDFNSHVRRAPTDEQRFVRAFAAEIASTAARVPRDQALAIGAGRVFQAQQPDAVKRHAQAQNLAGAEVAVGFGGQPFVFGKGLKSHAYKIRCAAGGNSTCQLLLSFWRANSSREISAVMP